MPLTAHRGGAGPCSGAAARGGRALAPSVRLGLSLAICACSGFVPAQAQSIAGPITYQLDPNHTFVTFEVRHFGTSTLRGAGEALSLYATSFACRHDEMLKRDVCGGDFFGDLKRGHFGATFGEPFVSDDVHLLVQVEAIAP